jgi:hypothetical protein
MTGDEKRELFGRLSSHVTVSLVEQRKSRWETFAYKKPILARFSVVLLAIAVIGMGTVFAAEVALPGDALYPVKIYVNEKVRSVMIKSPEERAEWAKERVERRIDEDGDRIEQIEKKFNSVILRQDDLLDSEEERDDLD